MAWSAAVALRLDKKTNIISSMFFYNLQKQHFFSNFPTLFFLCHEKRNHPICVESKREVIYPLTFQLCRSISHFIRAKVNRHHVFLFLGGPNLSAWLISEQCNSRWGTRRERSDTKTHALQNSRWDYSQTPSGWMS